MVRLRDALFRWRKAAAVFDALPAPEAPFAAIGDVHGRDDLLARMIERLDSEAPDMPVILVGDYVDRGPASAEALGRIRSLCTGDPARFHALKGNHEAMLLEFIDLPVQAGPFWLSNGGGKTLESFGVACPEDIHDEPALCAASEALAASMGEEALAWLRHLPLLWRSGNVVVTHAGGDPAQPFEARRGHGLLWGHPDFLRRPRTDGLWVVHGHYIVPQAATHLGRIAIDTGAWKTGRLSAALVRSQGVEFLTT